METITLNRKQLGDLMNSAAQIALDLANSIHNAINANHSESPDKLIDKSIAGIAGDVITKKVFNEVN